MIGHAFIYCENENNQLCQKLLFDKGIIWYSGKDQEMIDCSSPYNTIVVFFVNLQEGMNTMSYGTMSEIKKDYIYFKEYFKKELREYKLNKLVNNEHTS